VVVVGACVVVLSVALAAGAGAVVAGAAVVVEIPMNVPFSTYPNKPEVWNTETTSCETPSHSAC